CWNGGCVGSHAADAVSVGDDDGAIPYLPFCVPKFCEAHRLHRLCRGFTLPMKSRGGPCHHQKTHQHHSSQTHNPAAPFADAHKASAPLMPSNSLMLGMQSRTAMRSYCR